MTDSIQLTEEKEKLFITLYAKVLDFRSKKSILNDKTADDLLKTVDIELRKYEGFGNKLIVIRAKQFDIWIEDFIMENKNAIIVYLGCGLDTRYSRINPPSGINWFDVDYPEVINLRKTYYSENKAYKMIGSSVTDTNWLNPISNNKPTLIIAEGLLEYLTIKEVKGLFNRLTNYFAHGQMIFDVMNSFAVKSGKKELQQTTGAVHKWAVDDVREIDSLDLKLKRLHNMSVFKSIYIRKLPLRLRFILSLVSVIPKYKNMIRLLKYEF